MPSISIRSQVLLAALLIASTASYAIAQPDLGVDGGIDEGGESHFFERIDVPVPHHGGETHFRRICFFEPYRLTGSARARLDAYRWLAAELLAEDGLELQVVRAEGPSTVRAEEYVGRCDAILVPGDMSLPFGATLEAVGGIPDFATALRVLRGLAKQAAVPLLQRGKYEIAGIHPIGFSHLLRRRDVPLSGRVVVVPRDSEAVATLVKHGVGGMATVKPRRTACAAADAEQYAGCVSVLPVGHIPDGFVVGPRIGLATYQVVIRRDRFPDGFGQASRDFFAWEMGEYLGEVQALGADIKLGDTAGIEAASIEPMLTSVRIRLRDAKRYHTRAITLLFKARCLVDSARAECIFPHE